MRLPWTFLLAIATAAGADQPEQALVTYEAQVGGGQISGVSHSLEWSATALTPQSAQIRLRVPIDSFDSGHADFDSQLRAAVDSARFPAVEVQGVARQDRFEGTISLHGVTRPFAVHVDVARADDRVIASASFQIDLREFDVSLPSAGSKISVDFVARLTASPQAVVSGGILSWSN